MKMTDNARKIFDMLGVEPYEKFRLEIDPVDILYYITEDLDFIATNGRVKYNVDDCFRLLLTNKKGNIIKLPNKKKKKLRDLAPEEYYKWREKKCYNSCRECIFVNVCCYDDDEGWVNHKDMYSDKFLDQEIEVEE